MGYVVIKASGNAYALNRSMQNLTPVDSAYRHVIPSNATFTYNHVTQDGICTLQSVDLKGGTLPYVYRLCTSTGDVIEVGSRAGVTINEINGVITLGDNYDGQDVYVKLLPLRIQDHPDFYTTVVTSIFKKVIAANDWTPVTPEPTHTASLDAIVYSFGDNLNWNANSLTAALTQLNLTSVTVTYDGELSTFSGNSLSDFINDVTNILIEGTVGNTGIVNETNTLRQFTVSANTSSSSRTILFEVSFKYKGVSVSYTLPSGLMLAANELISVTNPTGPLLVEVGTTLNASDYSATGTYSNGSTATINATSISPGTVTDGANTYTLTFTSGVTTTIQITGQLTIISKAYISGVENPYPTKDINSYSWPLYVEVTHLNGTVEDMKFTDYNSLNEVKETYAAPVVTYKTGAYANSGLIDSLTGTMSFDFSNANYIYDHSCVLNISITCTSNSERSVTTTSSSGYPERYLSDNDHDFFDNNFTKVLLTTDNYLSVSSKTLHISNDRSNIPNGTIMLSDSGTAYYLNKTALANDGISTTDFYIGVSGYEGAIISNTSNNVNTTSTYSFRPKADVKLVRPDANSRIVYVHHTPSSSDYTTYLITFDYLGSQQAVWYLFVPKNSEYSPITVTSELSVSPSSLPASGGTVTITPPTYSQTHGSETITSDAIITYTLDGTPVTPTNNNTLLLAENLTNTELTRVLEATITLNGVTATSTAYIVLAANLSATFPAITSIVTNTVNNKSYPYKQDSAAGTLVDTNNKLQIEFPLEVNVSGAGKMTYELYKNTYPNSTYGNVTATFKDPNSSGALYSNSNQIDPTTGNLVIDLKANNYIIDRTALSRLTINNSNGSNVVLSSDMPTIHKHVSSTVKNYFEDTNNFEWNTLGFTSSNTKAFVLSSSHKVGSSYSVDDFKFSTSSSTGRLRLLDTANCYYIRIKYSNALNYFNFAVIEVPNGGTLSPVADTVYNGNTYNVMLGGYYTTGVENADEGATGWMYIKYTPTNASNKVYYVDALSSDKVSNMTVQIGQPN